jgi:hypothetical protein
MALGKAEPVEIRKLTEHDAAEWWRLRLEALVREPQAFRSAAEDHRKTTVEAVGARIASAAPGSFILVRSVKARWPRHKGRVWGVYVTEVCRAA